MLYPVELGGVVVRAAGLEPAWRSGVKPAASTAFSARSAGVTAGLRYSRVHASNSRARLMNVCPDTLGLLAVPARMRSRVSS